MPSNLMSAATGQETWMADAACRPGAIERDITGAHPDDFAVPSPLRGVLAIEAVDRALRTCVLCGVRPECLAYGLRTRDAWSVLGGFTPEQRATMARNEEKGASVEEWIAANSSDGTDHDPAEAPVHVDVRTVGAATR